MFSNYLKVALRVLWRNKIYVALNIVGLGFAIACAILAYLNYNYRANFDSNHTNTANIYRINSNRLIDGSQQPWAVVPSALAEAVRQDASGSAQVVRLANASVVIKAGEHVFDERMHFADKNLFHFSRSR